MDLDAILKAAYEADASDMHIVAGQPPTARIHQVMTPMSETPLTPQQVEDMLKRMTRPDQQERLRRDLDLDFSYEVSGLSRYRVNAHYQRGMLGMALRQIKTEVPPLSALHLPEVIARLTYLPRGLVLVTGDTGRASRRRWASMIQAMNERYAKHIITLEDPVEYLFESDKCLIEHASLKAIRRRASSSGLKHALRQDPDIILAGEMRDPETTSLAISAAETGHLVLSTLHTVNASQTVSRIIDMYPSGQQAQIRSMLSTTLQAVVSQTPFTRADRPGMIPAVETLLCTPAVRNLIREAKMRSRTSSRRAADRDVEPGLADRGAVLQRVDQQGGRARAGRASGQARASAGRLTEERSRHAQLQVSGEGPERADAVGRDGGRQRADGVGDPAQPGRARHLICPRAGTRDGTNFLTRLNSRKPSQKHVLDFTTQMAW
ncbi:MAG: PilT/PilU family type 4a pilus ATPase [Phycisphaerales bacterium]